MTAGIRGPRVPPGTGTEIAASAATLAYNVLISQATTSGAGYVTANACAATVSVLAARHRGVSWARLGMVPGRLGRGIRIGLATALPIASVAGLGVAVPATRRFFRDERAVEGDTRHGSPAAAHVQGDPKRMAGIVLATVTATTVAGYGLAWLRFRSGSLAAPAVAHASLNAAAYLAARFAVHGAA